MSRWGAVPGGPCQPLPPNCCLPCWPCPCCPSRLQRTAACPFPVPQKPDALFLFPQCTNPLPGLTKLEDCCGSVGLFWGADRCLACPPRPGECCCCCWDGARYSLKHNPHPQQAHMVRLPCTAKEAWSRVTRPLPCGSPLPKAFGDRQHVQDSMQGHACSTATPRSALVWALAPGSALYPQTCKTLVHLVVPTMPAPLGGKTGKEWPRS